MRKIILLFISLFFAGSIYAQNASTYFPSGTGYKWFYKNTPLDSLNNPMPSLARYRIDTFALVQNYHGLQANIVRIKDNLISINQNTPYTDTSFHNFQGTNGYEYLNLSLIPDTTGLPIGIINFFKGLQGWYNVYQFAATVGSSYQILTKDTTVLINSLPVHLRVKASAIRLADQQVSTVNGTYLAKKFVVSYGLYVVVLIIEQPVVVTKDTTWLASGVWMVKDIIPSVNLDLSQFGYGSYSIPGRIYELTQPVGIRIIASEVPGVYSLYQNYPNPFNPSTKIKFKVKDSRFVTLKVFDVLGREVKTLVNEKLSPGTYESTFDGNGLNSDIYFYKLEAGDFSEVKKMILIK